MLLPIGVIAVEPGDKASFVHSCIQMRLMGQHNENGPISLIYLSKLLITAVTPIGEITYNIIKSMSFLVCSTWPIRVVFYW